MSIRRSLFCFLLLVVCGQPGWAQEAEQKVRLTFAQEDWAPAPLDVWRNAFFFKASVAGREVWVLLDNGSEHTIIDMGLARELGLDIVEDAGTAETMHGGVIARSKVRDVPFAVPGQLSFRADMAGLDLASFSEAIGRPVGLIFGADYFRNLAVALDGARKTIIIRRSGSITPKAGRTVLEIPLAEDETIEAMIAGKPARLRLDLGNNGTISIYKRDWGTYISSAAVQKKSQAVDASGMIIENKVAQSVAFEIGPVKGVGPVQLSQTGAEGANGFLGAGLFLKFNTVFDFPARKIILILPPNADGPGRG